MGVGAGVCVCVCVCVQDLGTVGGADYSLFYSQFFFQKERFTSSAEDFESKIQDKKALVLFHADWCVRARACVCVCV